MAVQCVRIPLKPEAAEEFLQFLAELREEPGELAAVLREEGMRQELVFVERTDEGVSIVLFTRADDLEHANAAYLASTHPIQVRMRELSARAFDLSNIRLLEVALDA